MTEQEKQAVETLTRSFTKMETLYKIKCTEVETKENEIAHLKTENAALRERLEKSVELPAKVMIERTIVNGKLKNTQKAQAFNGRIGVVYRDETKWNGLLVDICSENHLTMNQPKRGLRN